MPQQACGHRRLVEHRRLARLEAPRIEATQRAPGRDASHLLRRLELVRIARRRVPVIPLHACLAAADYRTAYLVTCRAHPAEKAVRVAVDLVTLHARDGRALRVGDTRIARARGVLARHGELDGPLHVERPGVIEVEIRYLRRQPRGIGQPVTGIGPGVARDGARRTHGVGHRRGREIRGARRADPVVEVDGHHEALVAGVLYGLQRTHTHGRREAAAAGHGRLGGADTEAAGLAQDALDQLMLALPAFLRIAGAGGHVQLWHGPACDAFKRPPPRRR